MGMFDESQVETMRLLIGRRSRDHIIGYVGDAPQQEPKVNWEFCHA